MYTKEKFLEMLASNNASIRYEACDRLLLNQESSPEIVQALQLACQDPDPDVAERANLALQADVHHQLAIELGIIQPDPIEQASSQTEPGATAGIHCPSCFAENPQGAIFCNHCGASLATPGWSEKPKSHKNWWILLGVIIGVLILAGIGYGLIMGYLKGEVKPISIVVDSFIKEIVAKDIEDAYELFSPRVQRQMPITTLENQANMMYLLVEGYESITIQNIKVSAKVDPNQDMPQGTVGEVSGIVTYEDGLTGTFTAVLEKVEGKWKLHGINIQAPPEKLQQQSP